jgi:hypothetical protein
MSSMSSMCPRVELGLVPAAVPTLFGSNSVPTPPSCPRSAAAPGVMGKRMARIAWSVGAWWRAVQPSPQLRSTKIPPMPFGRILLPSIRLPAPSASGQIATERLGSPRWLLLSRRPVGPGAGVSAFRQQQGGWARAAPLKPPDSPPIAAAGPGCPPGRGAPGCGSCRGSSPGCGRSR